VQALVLRAGLAYTLGDALLAGKLLSDAKQIPLDDGERTDLSAELERAADLASMLE
jgi:hypothetical protein